MGLIKSYYYDDAPAEPQTWLQNLETKKCLNCNRQTIFKECNECLSSANDGTKEDENAKEYTKASKL